MAVFTPSARIACPASVIPSASPQPHPAACPLLTAGGTIVVRGFAEVDGADSICRPSANSAVIVAKYSFVGSTVQPCAVSSERQYVRTVLHAGSRSDGFSVCDACSVPSAASNSRTTQELNDRSSLCRLKYNTNDVSPSTYPGRSTRSSNTALSAGSRAPSAPAARSVGVSTGGFGRCARSTVDSRCGGPAARIPGGTMGVALTGAALGRPSRGNERSTGPGPFMATGVPNACGWCGRSVAGNSAVTRTSASDAVNHRLRPMPGKTRTTMTAFLPRERCLRCHSTGGRYRQPPTLRCPGPTVLANGARRPQGSVLFGADLPSPRPARAARRAAIPALKTLSPDATARTAERISSRPADLTR